MSKPRVLSYILFTLVFLVAFSSYDPEAPELQEVLLFLFLIATVLLVTWSYAWSVSAEEFKRNIDLENVPPSGRREVRVVARVKFEDGRIASIDLVPEPHSRVEKVEKEKWRRS